MVRLFVAIDLGEEARAVTARAIAEVAPLAPLAKWVRPEAMHVTLAFLGPTPEERVAAIGEAIRASADAHAPMALTVERGGAFGARTRPRVLWLGLGGAIPELVALQSTLASALVPLGYEPEARAFAPHLTLARARDKNGDAALARCVAQLASVRFEDAIVTEVILFRSDLSPKGARYTPIERAPLRGA
jgi:2'-5' RNA ligase